MIKSNLSTDEHSPPTVYARLEPVVQEINLRIASACKLEAISDILCQQFEQQLAVKLANRKIRELAPTRDFIRREGEAFINKHQRFLESRNPCDALSLLENPGRQGSANGRSEAFLPTIHTPGSEGKIAVLQARQSAGLPLWHPEDATYDVAKNTRLKHLLVEHSQSEETA